MSIELEDLYGEKFAEGDRVATSTTKGIRVGEVVSIKGFDTEDWQGNITGTDHKVFIDLADHKKRLKHGLAPFVSRMGYEYDATKFLKL